MSTSLHFLHLPPWPSSWASTDKASSGLPHPPILEARVLRLPTGRNFRNRLSTTVPYGHLASRPPPACACMPSFSTSPLAWLCTAITRHSFHSVAFTVSVTPVIGHRSRFDQDSSIPSSTLLFLLPSIHTYCRSLHVRTSDEHVICLWWMSKRRQIEAYNHIIIVVVVTQPVPAGPRAMLAINQGSRRERKVVDDNQPEKMLFHMACCPRANWTTSILVSLLLVLHSLIFRLDTTLLCSCC